MTTVPIADSDGVWVCGSGEPLWANQSVMVRGEDVLLEMEGVLNGILAWVPPHRVTCKGLMRQDQLHVHAHIKRLAVLTKNRQKSFFFFSRDINIRKKHVETKTYMHAYIQCMRTNGWQGIFFLTPATSCNTSLSGSLPPPIRICTLVIRGGLRQKVEQTWH